MFDLHNGVNRFGDALWLIPIDRIGAPRGYRAETAAAGADVPQDHERRRACPPAFAHIRAVAAFANGMEFMRVNQTTHMLITFADGEFNA